MDNPYAQQYATLSTKALLAITHNPEEYEPLAVQAARAEIEKRNISSEEQQVLITELKEEQQHPSESSLSYQTSSLARAVVRAAVPVYHNFRHRWLAMEHVAFFAAITTFLALVSLWNHKWIIDLWRMNDLDIDGITLLSVVEALWMPIAAVLLWRKHKTGWGMAVILLSANITMSTISYASFLADNHLLSNTTFFSSSFDALLPALLFQVTALLLACRTPLRKQLQISHRTMQLCLIIPAGMVMVIQLVL